MNYFVKLAVNAVLKWAYGLKPEDFAKAFEFVKTAQATLTNSADRRAWVQDQLSKLLKSRGTGRAINLLIELAVARLGK